MKVTVCQLDDRPAALESDWAKLVEHVREQCSDLVLLPEMPFFPWFVGSAQPDAEVWASAVEAHDRWEGRLQELEPAVVLGTRPIDFGNERYNEGFIWDAQDGSRGAHAKAFLQGGVATPDAVWYNGAYPQFVPALVGTARVGFLIGAELWAVDEARLYGEENVDVLVTPRATGPDSLELWLDAEREAATAAHAWGLSSNRVDARGAFGGQGWVISPEGRVAALTDAERPFVTCAIERPRDSDAPRPSAH